MALPMDLNSFGQALMSGDQALVQSRLSKITDRTIRNRRVHRNAVLRSQMKTNALPPNVKEFQTTNPEAHGLPRSYKVSFNDILPDRDSSSIDGATIVFGQFGHETGGVTINDHTLESKHVSYCQATKSYHLTGIAQNSHAESHAVEGYFNFNSDDPMGSLGVNDATFNVTLTPDILKFNVKVSANAGAYFSTAKKMIEFDPDSVAWKRATWEDTMEFGYGIKIEADPILGQRTYIENYFVDKKSHPFERFELTSNMNGPVYTSLMDGTATEDGSMLVTTVSDVSSIPDSPTSRADSSVKSVFPELLAIKFSPFGGSFVGGYKDKAGNIYAVTGEVAFDLVDGLFTTLGHPAADLPVHNVFAFQKNSVISAPAVQDEELIPVSNVEDEKLTSLPTESRHFIKPKILTAKSSLTTNGLLSMNPMVVDKDDPSGYRDTVAKLAMKDFHDIIVYYMDDDLRTTFVSATPQILSAGVKAIADDNVLENRTFYKKLQVPYIATFLASSTLSGAQYINGIRAEKLLRLIPADDPVYERQSSALYRLRFLEKFPIAQEYLSNQRNSDHSADIDRIATVLKENLKTTSAGLDISNPNYNKDLAKAQADVDSLATWAKDKRLYWAFMLFYWIQTVSRPSWYAQYTSGRLSSSLGMTIKSYNCIFGILENNQVNPGGVNFMQAFGESIQLFQMTSIIPQLVDLDGNSSEFDSLLKECLYEFWKHYKDSQDQTMNDRAQAALRLYQQQQTRDNFYLPLLSVTKVSGAALSWAHLMQMWSNNVTGSVWYQVMEGSAQLLEVMGVMASVSMMFMPLMAGGVENMTDDMFMTWIGSMVGVSAMTFIRIAQGTFRLVTFWSHIAGFGDCLKTILGFEGAIDALAPAARNTCGALADFFVRTSAEAASPGAQAGYSVLQKMFGRNLGEIIGTVAGIVLSVITLIWSAIELAQEKNSLMIASHSMFLVASIIQIFAIAAGWVMVALVAAVQAGMLVFGGGVMIAIGVMNLCTTWMGPAAVVFAIVGMIIMIIWMALQDKRTPVEKFADDKAKPLGLYMQYLAIDYFADIPATSNTAQLVGVSIRPNLAALPTSAAASSIVYLSLNTGGNIPVINYSKELQYTTTDIWSISTDAYGNTVFVTKYYKDGIPILYYLATDDTNSKLVARELPSQTDATAYKQALAHVRWTVEVIAPPTTAADIVPPTTDTPVPNPAAKQPLSALCTIVQANKMLSLTMDSTYTPVGLALVDITDPQPALINSWMLEMQPMGPGNLTYRLNPWDLVTTQTDERNFPKFIPDNTSEGLTWTVQPGLPAPFELVTTPGSDEGCLRMKKGQTLGEMPSTSFAIKCTLKTAGGSDISRTTHLSIKVEKPIA